MLISQLCKEQDFHTKWFKNACLKLRHTPKYHRKLWEYCYIYQGLLERGVLSPNKKGLGFGVGKEPLVSLFASHGCQITATDLDLERAKKQGWVDSNQHSNALSDLNQLGICDPEQFANLVTFENMDMNHISDKYVNTYDFIWSSCSFEHCGSIELGKRFIINQMECLRPGGIAIHTTEFNLSSNEQTLDNSGTVLFRKQDIEWMVQTLQDAGHSIEIDYSVGTGPIESYIDVPPYLSNHHLRLLIGQFVSTSIGLIMKKKET
ncbi:MAG: class I SAM-dependent methyltransferase [Paenibacillus dendritiformis]|uniref:SAM-dependent methyltransferase n=1 Tax=uncultured Paenibacillus sp. TaxID=227322 RepID=UPI0025FCF4D5|nr:class I SAM-dependent methyltransferase [uncultured Paenibacillus sp.]MDU5144064.1 class I SAM-dependent methyltransferase [Paenibacillus dendritiformis]